MLRFSECDESRRCKIATAVVFASWLHEPQDVVQFGPMGRTLFGQVLDDPGFVPQIFSHVGIPPMLDWVKHFAALGSYTLLDKVGAAISASHSMRARFRSKRLTSSGM